MRDRQPTLPSGPRVRVWRVVLMATVGLNGALLLTDAPARWLDESAMDDSSLPPVLVDVIQARPDMGDADLHVVAWFLPAMAAVLAGRSTRERAALVAVVWLVATGMEVAQPWMTEVRGRRLADAIGNTVGVGLGAGVGLALAHRPRRHRAATAAGVDGPGRARSPR